MAKFYLTDGVLPAEYIVALGKEWLATGFELRHLVRQFFGSRLFFAPEFRGNLIKSPVQFYLGLVQDMQLDVAPLPRLTLVPLRQMGQAIFYPPNVRGWVGGRQSINSATLTARRQFVESLFAPIDENTLNADEQIELVAARSNGTTRFTVPDEPFAPLARLDVTAAAEKLTSNLLPGTTGMEMRKSCSSLSPRAAVTKSNGSAGSVAPPSRSCNLPSISFVKHCPSWPQIPLLRTCRPPAANFSKFPAKASGCSRSASSLPSSSSSQRSRLLPRLKKTEAFWFSFNSPAAMTA